MLAGCGDNDRVASTPDAPGPQDDAAVVDNDPTHIKLSDGEVRGSVVGATREFRGIPYAKPPIGALRWRAPQKPEKWTSPLDATQFGKRCAQLENLTLQNAASDDEDCLYLSVWTPSPAPTTALPVMIWIHGGGNINGSTSEPVPFVNEGVFYSGQYLAEQRGVVVVSINYRLGLFGFFSHPALEPEGVSGNQGLLDQRLAMQWVHDNIAKFGGDPDVVTIFGESAGAQDVCFHVASPGSRGLFHRAISQSGGCTTLLRSHDDGMDIAVSVADELGCTGDGALECLRARSSAELMAAPAVIKRSGGGTLPSFGPDVDGQVLPDQPRALFDAGNIAKVPYLLGSNSDEGTLFVIGVAITGETQYRAALAQRFGGLDADPIAAVYPLADFTGAMPTRELAAFARAVGDSSLVCSTFDSATRAAGHVPVYMYNFSVPAPVEIPGVYLGATHGSELTSVFGTSPTFTAQARSVSDQVQRYWTNFARTGDPNGGLDPMWTPLTADANVRMEFALDPVAKIIPNFRAAYCAFWQTFYASKFPPTQSVR